MGKLGLQHCTSPTATLKLPTSQETEQQQPYRGFGLAFCCLGTTASALSVQLIDFSLVCRIVQQRVTRNSTFFYSSKQRCSFIWLFGEEQKC